MTRLVLLDSGEELGPASVPLVFPARALVRLKLLGPAPPFRDGQILRVAPLGPAAPPRRGFVLSRVGDGVRLHVRGDGPAGGGDALARVVAVERGQAVFSLERGLLAHVPACWLSRALDVLEVLGRLRHPFTPSLYLGSPDTCLAGVREKYDGAVEAREYARLAGTGLDPLERGVVRRHVRPGGRLLDIGCGAGREALGFAREGFSVVGIDLAPQMVEAACENAGRAGLEITFRVQSATELDDPPASWDGAFWAGSYHHVPGRALRVEALRRIGRALTPDGALILLVVYRGPRGLLSRSRLVDLLRRVGRRLGSHRRLSEPGDGYMRETSEGSDAGVPCFFHDFKGPDEVREEIEAAGLKAEEVAPGCWVCRTHLSG